MRTDIVSESLSVKELIRVIRSQNRKHHTLLQVTGRRSDAFVFVLAGSCRYTFDDGREVTVRSGDILYLAHHANYTMFIDDDQYRYIYCDFEFLSERERKSDAFHPQDQAHTEHLFVRLLNTYWGKNASVVADSMSVLYSIYGAILHTANIGYMDRSLKSRVAEIKDYMDAHFDDGSISVSELARRAEMSETYFRKLFRAEYGRTPVSYLISLRLEKACGLMEYPFLTLEDCAEQSGFSTPQYFCRVFQKELGVTPSAYRREHMSRGKK